MESVDQPNDVHEQGTRDFQFVLPFWISTEMPQTRPETAGCDHLIFNAARRTDKLWICLVLGTSLHAAASSKSPIHLATAFRREHSLA